MMSQDQFDIDAEKRRLVQEYIAGIGKSDEVPSGYTDRAAKTNMLANIFEGLTQAGIAGSVARGGRGVDSSFFGRLAQQGVQADEAKRKAVLDNLAQRKSAQLDRIRGLESISGMQKEDMDAAERKRIIEVENDPNSQESTLYRDLASKLMPGRDFSGASAAQLKSAVPMLQKMYDMDLRSQERQDQKARQAQLDEETRRFRAQTLDLQERQISQKAQERQDEKQKKLEEKEQKLFVPGYGYALTETDAKALKDATEAKAGFDAKIDELIALRRKYGGEVMNREAVKRASQLSKDLLLEYKNMAKLGVLSKSDEDIINAIIPSDPLEFRPIEAAQGQDSILKNLESFRRDTDNQFKKRLDMRLNPEKKIEQTQEQEAPQLSAQDKRALEWANANPDDPRAAEIKRRLGQ